MNRPPIGTRYLITWGDGTHSGVTVVPTGKTVPDSEVNVMRDGDGSILTINVGRLTVPEGDALLAALQRVEEVLEAHSDTAWARQPATQEICGAIADIDLSGGWDPEIG
ncbi:hypothetical protein [Streptomyces anthocyanicus]|uniref:hypothetical protein n=1 Tax=Streptomyces anthocyanicus TaxID=68174 RepID=UPI003828EB61